MWLGLSGVVVFRLLAALYESWSVTVAVLLVVPLGVLGAVLFSMFRGLSADIYFNVGLITIIGLAAKNAILIVEFAIEQEAEGKSTYDAVMEAVKLRLRRSEEHTSELQSLMRISYAVFCLKKKKKTKINNN